MGHSSARESERIDPVDDGWLTELELHTGDEVEVRWGTTWWKAEILAELPDGGYLVHYLGWGRTFDQVVSSSQVRARTGLAREGAGLPPGVASC